MIFRQRFSGIHDNAADNIFSHLQRVRESTKKLASNDLNLREPELDRIDEHFDESNTYDMVNVERIKTRGDNSRQDNNGVVLTTKAQQDSVDDVKSIKVSEFTDNEQDMEISDEEEYEDEKLPWVDKV